jgi:hypothetical protein
MVLPLDFFFNDWLDSHYFFLSLTIVKSLKTLLASIDIF